MRNKLSFRRKKQTKLAKTKNILINGLIATKDSIIHAPEEVGSILKQNPLKSVGFSVLAGVLVTQLLRLRNLKK